MDRINRFDVICLGVIIAISLTLGTHVGRNSTQHITASALVTIKTEGIKGYAQSDMMIDGRIPVKLISADGDIMRVTAKCIITEAGYFLGEEKYLSVNQPLKLDFPQGCVKGRIIAITITED